jgi:hypothetical protein
MCAEACFIDKKYLFDCMTVGSPPTPPKIYYYLGSISPRKKANFQGTKGGRWEKRMVQASLRETLPVLCHAFSHAMMDLFLFPTLKRLLKPSH